jgi:hypothetical protein
MHSAYIQIKAFLLDFSDFWKTALYFLQAGVGCSLISPFTTHANMKYEI